MKKLATIVALMLIAVFGISGTAFAKRHHTRHHQKDTSAGQTPSNAPASTTGQTNSVSKAN